MKKQKFQFLILAAVCLLCAGGYFLIRGHEFEPREETVETVVTDFEPEEVTELTVTGNRELHFTKTDVGWTESSLEGEEIDQDSVNRLLRQISAVTTTETVVQAPEDVAQYGMDAPSFTIQAILSDGSSVTIYAGKESSLLSKYYIKVEGDDNVYLVSSYIVTDFDRAAEEFIREEETETETGM